MSIIKLIWIYKNYFLPANRFLLTIHDITDTHLKKLDTFTDKYVKKWAGLPLCATNAIIHLKTGLHCQRESNYTRKNCVTITAEHEYINALGSNTAQLHVPDFDYKGGEKDKDKFVN